MSAHRFSYALEVLRQERYNCADQARTVNDDETSAGLRALEAELDEAIALLESRAKAVDAAPAPHTWQWNEDIGWHFCSRCRFVRTPLNERDACTRAA